MKIFFDPTYNNTGIDLETFRKAERLGRRPVPGTEVLAPRSATLDEVLAVHDPDHVRDLREGGTLGSSNGLGWDDRLWGAVTSSAGGLLSAVEEVLANGGVAGSLSSGLHHARAGRGSGYCTINGLAIAATVEAGVRRVVILDVDAHCGGGTASIIEDQSAIDDPSGIGLLIVNAGVDPHVQTIEAAVEEFAAVAVTPEG